MTDKLINIDNLCTDPDNHKLHICELKKAGKLDEVETLQQHPRFICGNCAQKANVKGALCAPGPFHN